MNSYKSYETSYESYESYESYKTVTNWRLSNRMCCGATPKTTKKHKNPKDIGVWGRQSKKPIKPKNNKTKTKTYFNPICIIKQ